MKYTKRYFIIFGITLFYGVFAAADVSFSQNNIAIVVHPENSTTLTARQISNIYLGKTNTFPNQEPVTPIDQHASSLMREIFYLNIVGKKLKWVKKYWSKRIFTGDGEPPRVLDANDIKAFVATEKSAIGYIDMDSVDDSVRVIMAF